MVGDQLIAVNNCVVVGMSHKALVHMVRESAMLSILIARHRVPSLHAPSELEPQQHNPYRPNNSRPRAATVPTTTSIPETSTVTRRPDGRRARENQHRPLTLYEPTEIAMPKKKKNIIHRLKFKHNSGGDGGTASILPASLTVEAMTGENAARVLAAHNDGAFLFRESHGRIVLSVVQHGEVANFTLQISLQLSYKELEKELRRFVKYYRHKRHGKSELGCTLEEYVTDVRLSEGHAALPEEHTSEPAALDGQDESLVSGSAATERASGDPGDDDGVHRGRRNVSYFRRGIPTMSMSSNGTETCEIGADGEDTGSEMDRSETGSVENFNAVSASENGNGADESRGCDTDDTPDNSTNSVASSTSAFAVMPGSPALARKITQHVRPPHPPLSSGLGASWCQASSLALSSQSFEGVFPRV